MNPSKPAPGITFNTTESMAEWEWRYGEAGVPHTPIGFGLLEFEDGSCMSPRCLHSRIGWRCLLGKLAEKLDLVRMTMMTMSRTPL